jgi:hypothetical protein
MISGMVVCLHKVLKRQSNIYTSFGVLFNAIYIILIISNPKREGFRL